MQSILPLIGEQSPVKQSPNKQHLYMTPPSQSKKKAFMQLQNAPSSRKGQSTLDTSPDKKTKCIEECISPSSTKEPEFQQELFKLIINECDKSTQPMAKAECAKEIQPQSLLNFGTELINLFNTRDKNVLNLFESDAKAMTSEGTYSISELLYNMSSNMIGICTENIALGKVEQTMEGCVVQIKTTATMKEQQNKDIIMTLCVTGSLKISQIAIQIMIN